MQRILIDVTRLVYRRLKNKLPTGIDRVSLQYIHYYSRQPGSSTRAVLSLGPFSAVLSPEDSAAVFAALCDANVTVKRLAARVIAKAVGWRWLSRDVADCFLFNTGHMGLENPHYAWMLRRSGARPVIVVHDLIPITHPEYCRSGERQQHLTRMNCAVKISAGIISNSTHTLQTLVRFCRGDYQNGIAPFTTTLAPRLNMPPCVVAPLAPGLPMMATAEIGKRPMQKPYFVILGTIEPRKNHWLLLQIWRQLIETMGVDAPKLVLIGQRGWKCENVIDLLELSTQLKGAVIERSDCSDAELISYLHHAQALLFPSFAEGYGMPVAEALSLGAPVIASDLDAFREMAGDIPEYADPLDGKRWAELIAEYSTQGSAMRAAQLQRITQFQPSTWVQHFALVDGLLDQLSPGKNPAKQSLEQPRQSPEQPTASHHG